MKLYRGDDNKLFTCQIPFSELKNMNVTPDMIIHDERIRSEMIDFVIQSAINHGYANPNAMFPGCSVGMELDTDHQNINISVMKPQAAEKSFMEMIMDELMQKIAEECDEDNDNSEDDIPAEEPVTVIAEYRNIIDILNICKIIKALGYCDLKKSCLFLPNEHETKNKRFLHLQITNSKYETLLADLNEFSDPVSINAFVTEDPLYGIHKAGFEEHYKCIEDITAIADI